MDFLQLQILFFFFFFLTLLAENQFFSQTLIEIKFYTDLEKKLKSFFFNFYDQKMDRFFLIL